ncbi:hypothetical protein MNBD_GAMMA20-1279 [hydrothermal vent metagenome]|uniref:Uncharacterized protein n=1 Tax=hydrothermal vent metagenome TaxID=652676 RepID=A0A3B1AAY2_9ZZZZ
MTSVNMPRDDAAININTKAVAKRDVKPTEPYPATPPVKEHEEGHVAAPPVQARQQRRQGDRRQKGEPVLLDTRTGRDRRKGGKQDDDDDTRASHIDVYI